MLAQAQVDKNGDITAHRKEGVEINVLLEGTTAGELAFHISDSGAVINLTAHPTLEDTYVLIVPQTRIDALPAAGALFALVVSSGLTPIVFWEGTIRRRGF